MNPFGALAQGIATGLSKLWGKKLDGEKKAKTIQQLQAKLAKANALIERCRIAIEQRDSLIDFLRTKHVKAENKVEHCNKGMDDLRKSSNERALKDAMEDWEEADEWYGVE